MTGATCGRELRRWLEGAGGGLAGRRLVGAGGRRLVGRRGWWGLAGGPRGGGSWGDGPLDPGCSWGLAGSSRAVRGRSEGQEAVGVGLCILRGTEMVHNHAWRERN